MVKIKKLLITLIASLPLPALAERLNIMDISPRLETNIAQDSLIAALTNGYAPEDYYNYLDQNNINSLPQLLEEINKPLLQVLVDDWSNRLADETLMANTYLSIGNGSNKGNRLL